MAEQALREIDAKNLIAKLLEESSKGEVVFDSRRVSIDSKTDLKRLANENPWLKEVSLVAKTDQLIKRRGAQQLLLLNKPWKEVSVWLNEKGNKEISVDGVTGLLENFIVEPFVPHKIEYEYYLAIRSKRRGDEILFFRQGGVDVGDVESKAKTILIPPLIDSLNRKDVDPLIKEGVGKERREVIAKFIKALFAAYRKGFFTYLEINPLAVNENNNTIPLDVAAKIDLTARHECEELWEDLVFLPLFGQKTTKEEEFIKKLDQNSGSSLKFSLLNPKGKVWTLVAGGGASVVYADTVADLGYAEELANYGEYSGNPAEEETYQYTRTILGLMTADGNCDKTLLIGGGIANFTDVAKTFKGIIRALREFKEVLRKQRVKIFVRRGGPNYKVGLQMMKDLGKETGVHLEIYGPETPMTRIVRMALEN